MDLNSEINDLESKFKKLDLVAEGAYGKVYKGFLYKTNQVVAIKEMKNNLDYEGIPSTILREIGILKRINHQNIIK